MAAELPVAWVTGAGGLIGSYIIRQGMTHGSGWKIRPLTRPDLDLQDFGAVRNLFAREQPRLVIHCAAITRSPVCEAEPQRAWKLNVEATKVLAELSSEIRFIFFSSDLVFDGRKGNYDESDAPSPLGVYGRTKAAAEAIVLQNPRHIVIRTSLNAGASPAGDRSVNEEMVLAWKSGKAVRLFTDEFRSPIPAEVTARAIWELVSRGAAGLFHVAGVERMSRSQLGELIAQRWPELQPKIEKASLREYQGAPRSPDTTLNCSKVQKLLSFPLPALSDWLQKHPQQEAGF